MPCYNCFSFLYTVYANHVLHILYILTVLTHAHGSGVVVHRICMREKEFKWKYVESMGQIMIEKKKKKMDHINLVARIIP